MTDRIAAVARSVLYEGYILWPYRRSALKNQRRWTFGGVFPEAYSHSGHADDACVMRTECLLETGAGAGTELSVRVRFLHLIDRRVARVDGDALHFVDSLTVQGVTHVAWHEAAERGVSAPPVRLAADLGALAVSMPIAIEGGEWRETLIDSDGLVAGAIVRRWERLAGSIHIHVESISSGLAKVRVDIKNEGDFHGESREQVLFRTFLSTHTALHVQEGQFVSLLDPPPAMSTAASHCVNVGTWPVLIGDSPDRTAMLSSPIILYDYPEVAPESTGDFFDAAEIDQLLVLSVLAMTEDEQARMRETDPRARAILDRCQSLTPEAMMRLHGIAREISNERVSR